MKKSRKKSIWVFGDYRNYYQNRVTLQLISKAVDLAKTIKAEVCALIFGHEIDEWIIDEFKTIGCDTAKSVLELSIDELVQRTDLEEETIKEVIRILKSEFE